MSTPPVTSFSQSLPAPIFPDTLIQSLHQLTLILKEFNWAKDAKVDNIETLHNLGWQEDFNHIVNTIIELQKLDAFSNNSNLKNLIGHLNTVRNETDLSKIDAALGLSLEPITNLLHDFNKELLSPEQIDSKKWSEWIANFKEKPSLSLHELVSSQSSTSFEAKRAALTSAIPPPGPPVANNLFNLQTLSLPHEPEFDQIKELLSAIAENTNVDSNRKFLQEELQQLQPDLGTIDASKLGVVNTGIANSEHTSWSIPPSNIAWDPTIDGPIPVTAWYETMLNKVDGQYANRELQPAVILGPNNVRQSNIGLDFSSPKRIGYQSGTTGWTPAIVPDEGVRVSFSSPQISQNYGDYTLSKYDENGEELGNQAVRYHRAAVNDPNTFYDSYLVMGSAWVANHYANASPKITFGQGIGSLTSIKQAHEPPYHYKIIDNSGGTFLLSATVPLQLKDNAIQAADGADLSNIWINYTQIPANLDYRGGPSPINDQAVEDSLWESADFFTTCSQSSVVSNTRAVVFRGVDYLGQPSDGSPLFAIPITRQDSLSQIQNLSTPEWKKEILYETGWGTLRPFTAKSGVFFFQDPLLNHPTDALGSMTAITDSKVIPQKVLDTLSPESARNLFNQTIASIKELSLDYQDLDLLPNNTYYAGKIIWNETVLLQEAALLGQKIGDTSQNESLDNFSSLIQTQLNKIFNNLRYDQDFSQIVMAPVDYNNTLGSDHTTISGYLGNASTLLTQYQLDQVEKGKKTLNSLWINQKTPSTLSHGEIVDLLLQDTLNPTANQNFVAMQSSNPYYGNLWQSGKGMQGLAAGAVGNYTHSYIAPRTLSEDKENINTVFFMKNLGEIKERMAALTNDADLKNRGEKLQKLATVMLLEQRKFEQTIMQKPDQYLPNSYFTQSGQIVNIVTTQGIYGTTYFGDDESCRFGEPNLVPFVPMMLLTSLDDQGKPTAFAKQVSDWAESKIKKGTFWQWTNNVASTTLVPYALFHPDAISSLLNDYLNNQKNTLSIKPVLDTIKTDSYQFLTSLQTKAQATPPSTIDPQLDSLIVNLKNNLNSLLAQAKSKNLLIVNPLALEIQSFLGDIDMGITKYKTAPKTFDMNNFSQTIWTHYGNLNYILFNSIKFDSSLDPATLAIIAATAKMIHPQ